MATRRSFLTSAAALAASSFVKPHMAQATPAPDPFHRLTVKDGQFQLDGKRFRIISGSMHYPRIPRADWRQRFRMAKAMGLNSITTYVFWNVHESKPGIFDFTGNNDVAEFVREAQQEGLYVILRPGPYICAEWDFGGFPAWLLKDRTMIIRSRDPKFIAIARAWLKRLGRELAPLQYAKGGPILAVQVENEYGSFGSDHKYMRQIHQALVDAGFDQSLFYTADGPRYIPNGSLPDMLAVANFGTGRAKESMEQLQQLRPTGPYMAGEYWAGWFDHWGEKHASTDGKLQAEEIEWMLRQGYSISIYMFHGGTSFGWMNGANSKSEHTYQPDVTSYDYDAALSESGHPTPKYFLFRDAIARSTGVTLPPVPETARAQAFPPVRLTHSISLWNTLPAPVHSEHLLTMEDLGQNYGYILYRTQLNAPVKGDLVFDALHQYAQVFLNGKSVGTVDRRLDQNSLAIDSPSPQSTLDVLVENTGRINFSIRIRGERQGILGNATLAGKTLTGWHIYSLPMDAPATLTFGEDNGSGPCFYRGTLHVDKPADTFLDTRQLRKGQLWVNGKNLGRFWFIGPQRALYLPASWLHAGDNDIVIFDLEAAPGRSIQSIDHPILGETVHQKSDSV